ncbi:MAG TPA: hypothetical protein VF950_23845 [Planctomycetota bacterium]
MDATLIRRFGDAGLDLRPALAPIQPSNPDIFQMDIRRLGRAEHFRVWPGTEASADVLSTDPKLRQLVLLVREPKRLFVETLPRMRLRAGELKGAARRAGGRLAGFTAETYAVERWTSGKSRYLCGMDERHLFIARLAGGTTVRNAHDSLRPRRLPSTSVRQGEWFFVPLTPGESGSLERMIAARRAVVLAKEPIGAGGHPHTADELVRLPAPRWTSADAGRGPSVAIFVRGAVRHPEHKTVRFRAWVSVVRNAEPGQTGPVRNVFWID